MRSITSVQIRRPSPVDKSRVSPWTVCGLQSLGSRTHDPAGKKVGSARRMHPIR
jgi:hypothetical protein